MLAHIDRQKYQIDFMVHSNEPGAYDEEVKALGARVIPCFKPSNLLQYAFNFRRVLRQYGPYDCVHSHVHHYSGYVLMLAAIMSVPIRIAQSHSDTRVIDRRSSPLRRAYLAGMRRLIQCFATVGIAVSQGAAECLFPSTWNVDRRWTVSPLGIDLHPFEQPVDQPQVRSELGIPHDAFVVGHVGRFVEVKNHRFLVDIAERFCRLEPRAVFLLVGDGPLKPEIESLVRMRGLSEHFVFAGIRQDVPRLMKGAMDCFLFPSLYEGLPLTLLEAQVAGLHCVASDTVPDEGDINHFAVAHLSLKDSTESWAHCLLKAQSRHGTLQIPREWSKARSIEGSTERTEALYRSVMTS
jgi:glycosyltransferase involved in cell wall biosynthesis